MVGAVSAGSAIIASLGVGAVNAVAGGGTALIGGSIYTGIYYGSSALITLGLSVGVTAATLPRPEAGHVNLRQPTPSRRFGYGMYRAAGQYAFWEAKGNWAASVVMLHDGEIDGFTGRYWLHDDLVELDGGGDVVPPGEGRYPAGFVNIQTRVGLFDETAYSGITAKFPEWTSAHRLDGIASLAQLAGHGNAQDFPKRYPNGEPMPSAEIRAQKVYDPRPSAAQDEDDPDTWTWSDNPVLALLHFEMYRRGRCYDEEISGGRLVKTFNQANWDRLFAPTIDSWIRAADDCDFGVVQKDGSTAKRYAIGGFAEESVAADVVRRELLASFDGWLAITGDGAFVLHAGRYRPPTVTLTRDEVCGYSFQRFVEDEQSINEYQITFTNPDTDYGEGQCDPWRAEADILSRGKVRAAALDLRWVQNVSQARRLAKRATLRNLATARGTIVCRLTAPAARAALTQRWVQLQIPDVVTLSNTPVEVMAADINVIAQTISFEFVTVNPTELEAWNPAAEEGEPPSSTTRPEPVAIDKPQNVSFSTVVESTGGGQQGARLLVSFDDPGREDYTFLVRWRNSGDTQYVYESFSTADDAGSVLSVLTGFVPSNASLVVNVAFVSGSGSPGDWSDDAVGASTVLTETTALIAAMTTAPNSARAGHINALISALKTAGIWATLDCLYVYAAHHEQASRVNWVDPAYVAGGTGSPVFAADEGWTGNGSTAYLHTGISPGAGGAAAVQNDHSLVVWSLSNTASAGYDAGSSQLAVISRNASDEIETRSSSTSSQVASVVTGAGLTGIMRGNGSGYHRLKNGASVGTPTQTSAALTGDEVLVLARNDGAGSPTGFSSRQIAALALGSQLSIPNELALYNALNTYLAAVGAV